MVAPQDDWLGVIVMMSLLNDAFTYGSSLDDCTVIVTH